MRPKSRCIDIPVKLSDVKVVFSIGALAFEGDLPASIFHMQLIRNDIAGWKAFAASLPTPDVAVLVRDRAPLEPIASYRFPANRHRHYEKLAARPSFLETAPPGG